MAKVTIHNNFGVVNFYEHDKKTEPACEDVTPEPSSSAPNNNSEILDSIIFTKKAKHEAKQTHIIEALRQSVQGRRDKTRAFVDELHSWQDEQYIDAHYNAQVMYDELDKMIPLSFGYDAFKRYYNRSRV